MESMTNLIDVSEPVMISGACNHQKETLLSASDISVETLHRVIRDHFLIFVVDGTLLAATRDTLRPSKSDKYKVKIRLSETKVICRADQLASLLYDDRLWKGNESRIDLLLKMPSRKLQFLYDLLLHDKFAVMYGERCHITL